MRSPETPHQDRNVELNCEHQNAGHCIDESVSISSAAARLGVSRSAIWHMIAQGELEAESTCRNGRVYTRVYLPHSSADPAGDLAPRAHIARLQGQVEQLTTTLERLTGMLTDSNRERTQLREALRREAAPPPVPEPASRPEGERGCRDRQPAAPPAPPAWETRVSDFGSMVPAMRPNPMTHPVEALPCMPVVPRDELLHSVRELFKSRRQPWWERLPLGPRT